MSTYKSDVNGDVGELDLSPVQTVSADVTLSYENNNGIFLVDTDAKTITLPATKKGIKYTFVNVAAAGAAKITISPQAVDGIAGTLTLAATIVTRPGTVDTDLVNTKATTTVGNSVTIVGTGVTGVTAWIIVSSTGIWA